MEVATGFVATLARPGGNITGLSLMAPELVGKQLCDRVEGWRGGGTVTTSECTVARHQPQDRQGARPHDPTLAAAAGGSGDRVKGRASRQNVEGWARRKTAPAPPVPKPARPLRRPGPPRPAPLKPR